MIKTPIVFSFNNSFTVPAGVCITSLLENANKNTYYEIFILHSAQRLSDENKTTILQLTDRYANCSFSFINLEDEFSDCFEIRDISVDAYYRLAIPRRIKHYDKVIYADVDVVFNGDLSHLMQLEMKGNHLAAVKIPVKNIAPFIHHMEKFEVLAEDYFNSGFFVMDLQKVREDGQFEASVDKLIKHNFTYQDQDILNILFKGKTLFLDKSYNYTVNWLKHDTIPILPFVVHYTGDKPWKTVRSFGELWWEYYRKSPFFDERTYMLFQKSKYVDLYNNNKIIKLLQKFGVVSLLKSFMKNK